MAEFLFEIGLEEVPARMLAAAQAELELRVRELLGRERLITDDAPIQSFSTPRRLAVHVRNVATGQADAEEELIGPPVKAAFKDGQPGPAAHAFAKKAGVPVESLRTVTNAKGEYLAAVVRHAGKPAAQVIASELPREIAAIYWSKNMYWRPGKPERFVRPVQWLLALLDGEVIPVEWGGRTASNVTYGHRILHGNAPVVIASPGEYAAKLYGVQVIANVEDRRQKIRKALDHVTRSVDGARWREDHPLVDKVTHLTEWPGVILGSFEADYLALPEEVLVTVMRDHQNYFAPEGGDGKLLPHFLAVLNTEAGDRATGIIRHGNERVLRARFNDARFFYEFDQRTPLEDRVALLEKVTFQKDLGSYAAKSGRVRTLAKALARSAEMHGAKSNLPALDEAALLGKTDLTCELVKEFTELQGIIGGLYARAQGKSEEVSQAIYDQYLPASMEDAIPRSIEGLLLSIADKADTISGMFGLGLQPTGSKDPFALRRAANGIIKMLGESTLPLTLSEIAMPATNFDTDLCRAVRDFLAERLEWYLREVRGGSYDVVKAVMCAYPEDVRDAVARVEAVAKARDSQEFAAIIAAFKRMRNIVEQAKAKGETIASGTSSQEFLTEASERTLAGESGRRAAWVEGLRRDGNYDQALATIAELRPFVDDFFEKVMVMAPEPQLRQARLGLLQRVLQDFSKIADFSEIVIAG